MLPISILLADSSAGGGALDTQTVTTGASGSLPDRQRGYSSTLGLGSINDGTSNIYGGKAITQFYWDENGEAGPTQLFLKITDATNTGWNSVTIGSTVFYRSDASFAANQWTWNGPGNPFGTSGTDRTCVFN